jgi:6-pyruvoyltetrahydropterin/6-carboxytetrahydropterin synthase
MVYLTRKEHFNAAHKLYNPRWDDETNRAVFGKCANDHWHGHNYDLYVTVKGMPDPDTGFIINAKELGEIIRQEIVEELDHRNLNLDVTWLQGVMPSTENLVMLMWPRLALRIDRDNCSLHCIKLFETERIYAEYYGP